MPGDPISSLANPRVKAAVKLRRSRDRRATGLLLAEGPREVVRAMHAGLVPRDLFVCESLLPPLEGPPPRWLESATPVSQPVLKHLAYRDEPEGLLGVFEAPRFSPTDLLAGQNPLILVAVGTAKPGNLGAMVRTAAAAGATGVLAAGAMVDPFNPNAIRASTGAVFEVPVVHMPEADAIAWLQQHRIQILAALVDGTDAYCEVEAAGPTAVVIGPEDSGLGPAWDAAARAGGASVRIPMSTTAVDSLNASVTAGILLFDAVRRRRELGG